MRTVYIMAEGPTEEEFINCSMAPYLQVTAGITNTVPILLETSPGYYGGDITFERYQLNANNLLLSDPAAIVTSLIDYYQLRPDFPGLPQSLTIVDKNKRLDFIEQQISIIIPSANFIPYIQLHEFEALLFSDRRGFDYIASIKAKERATIQYIINNYDNPEMINDSPVTAPSVRLKGLIPKYKKTFHGPLIALENGMAPVLSKCPRFRNWVSTITLKAAAP